MKTAILIAMLFAALSFIGCQGLAKQLGYVNAQEAESIFANGHYRTVLQPNTPASMDGTTPDKPNVLYVNVNICKPLGTVGDVARFACPKPPPRAEPEAGAQAEAKAEVD